MNGHPALALLYLQTIGADPISAQFVYLYKLPVLEIEPNTLATAINVSKGTIGQICDVELNWGGYEETRIFYEAQLSGWDMMLRRPRLQDIRATISAGTASGIIQPRSMDRFCLRMWRGNLVTDQKYDLSTAVNSILTQADELAVRAAELGNRFNPVVEYPALFRKQIPTELPPLRNINHKINIISGSSWIPTYRPSGDRCKQEITDKINNEEISGLVYRAEEDTNAVVMFTQAARDRPKKLRFQLDCSPRNAVTIRTHIPLPTMEEAIEFVAARSLCRKIDFPNGLHNIQIDPDSEKDTTFLCHVGHYRSCVLQQADCNLPATMVRVINEIFRDLIYKDLMIYIDDLIISRKNYKQHVDALRKVLQRLQDPQFWLKESKCQFFIKRLYILGHILTPEGLSADPLKVQTTFDFSEPGNKTQLQGFIAIVNYLSKFLPNLASTAAILTDRHGASRTCRWP